MSLKSYPYLTTLALALSLELVISSILPAVASQYIRQHQPEFLRRDLIVQRRARLRFKVPNISPSRNLEGGAARGKCSLAGANKLQMKALLPNSNIGLTTDKQPTFFFQMSQVPVQEATFILLNAQGDTIIYEKTFPLASTGGVMSFTLPADSGGLDVGKEYAWELVVNCDPDDHQGNPRVEGSIKRVPPTPKLVSDLAQASKRDRVALYASEGYWYDSLKILADLRSANPNDSTLLTDWKDLLESAGLNTVAQDPLIPCCTSINR